MPYFTSILDSQQLFYLFPIDRSVEAFCHVDIGIHIYAQMLASPLIIVIHQLSGKSTIQILQVRLCVLLEGSKPACRTCLMGDKDI